MPKRHAAVLSAILAAAAVFGIVALTQTVSLGQASSSPSPSVAERDAAIERAQAEIARLDASLPPPLPARDTSSPVASVAAAAPTQTLSDDDDRWEDRWEHERDDDEYDDHGAGDEYEGHGDDD